MNTVFTEILNMSITASWMIIAVVILRFFTRKISKNLNIFMWGLVGLRLLLPFSFKSKISAVPSAETFPTEPIIEKGYSINSGIPVIDVSVNNYIESFPMEQATETAKKSIDIMNVLGIVWLCGFAVLVFYGIISCVLLRRKVSVSMKEINNIYICDDIKGAFIFGIFKPRIYLPSLLPVWQREYVVYHEIEHLKRRDHIWKPVAFVIACLHWFNPFVWLAYILFCRDIELSCDERVVRKMDKDEKKSYSLALLACSIPRSKLVAAPLAFGEVGVKTRIKSALNYKKPAFWVIVVALIICIGVAVLFMTDPIAKPKDPEAEDTQEVISKDTETTDTIEPIEPTDTDEITYPYLDPEPEPAPEPEYVETPYPSGLTVEEKIAGYDVFEITPGEYGVDIHGFVTEKESSLPSEFAVTFTHIPDFAAIVRDEFDEYNSRYFYIKELYYKNTEVIVDINIVFDRNSHLVFDGNTVCIGDTYYTGHYYLLAPNTYMKLGGDRNKKYDNPLDADTTYKIEYKNDRLEYVACHVCSTVYTAFIDSSLFSYLYKPEDLDHDYSSWGEIKYSEGKWTIVEEGRYTIGERFADELEMRYEDEKKYHEDLRQYETYMDYLEAKEQGLLDKVHYYWDRDRD